MLFTYEVYENSLKKALKKDYKFVSFKDFNSEKQGQIILRHDVDADFSGALKFAEIEAGLGIKGTYFFQPNCDFYNMISKNVVSIINDISKLGHNIGLHIDFEQQTDTLVDYIKQTHMFYSYYFKLSRTISFHRPSKMILDNDLNINGIISAYDKKYFNNCLYISDSNRREYIDYYFEYIETGRNIQYLTHPLWWNSSNMSLKTTKIEILDLNYVNINNGFKDNFKIYRDK